VIHSEQLIQFMEGDSFMKCDIYFWVWFIRGWCY